MFNATRNDYLATNTSLYSKFQGKFLPWMVTNEGNAFLAALVLYDGQKDHPALVNGPDRNEQIAQFYNIYRGGDKCVKNG